MEMGRERLIRHSESSRKGPVLCVIGTVVLLRRRLGD
jgi:hypothetical protein